jgi:site-specific recombinase XerD
MIARYNYQCVKDFLEFLREVKGLKASSVKRYEQLLNHLLRWADDRPFPKVMDKRPTFLSYVRNLSNEDGSDLSLETKGRSMEIAKRFFDWAKVHRASEFRGMETHWIDMIQMPKTGSQQKENVYVSQEEILQIARLKVDPRNLTLLRDQAAAAMLFLSGMRAGAFTSAPIQAFDMTKRRVYQWPEEYGVKTKNGKKAVTYLMPINELLDVVMRWHAIVSAALPPTAPWYAPIRNEWGDNPILQEEIGKNRPAGLNKRLKVLFKAAGLPYKSAHKFRHGTAVFGLKNSRDMLAYKAVSKNLMHEDISITDGIYASLLTEEVGNQIASLGGGSSDDAE